MTAKEALEKLNHTICLNRLNKQLKYGLDEHEHIDCVSTEEFVECYNIIETALNRLEELEKVLRENLFYSNCCLDYSGKTYIDLRVEDDNPDFNLLKEYLR